jgi:hypothetical protein
VCLRDRVAGVSFHSIIRHIRGTEICCRLIGVDDRLKGIKTSVYR